MNLFIYTNKWCKFESLHRLVLEVSSSQSCAGVMTTIPQSPFQAEGQTTQQTWRNCFHNKQHSHLFLFDPHPRQNSKLKYSMPSWALASSGLPESKSYHNELLNTWSRHKQEVINWWYVLEIKDKVWLFFFLHKYPKYVYYSHILRKKSVTISDTFCELF